jgi:membrane protein implicated in regulation of membrane protease activity
MGIKLLYFACFIIGFAYAFIASVLSHFFGGDGDHGDIGHGDVGHADMSLPVLSPTIIAAFVTGFGGTGILVTNLTSWSSTVGVVVAVAGGLIVALSAFGLLGFIYSRTQGGSEYQTQELTGYSAEVITTIPENGFGEIAYEARGARANSPARSVDGKTIPKHAHVTIVKVVGSTFFVKPHED